MTSVRISVSDPAELAPLRRLLQAHPDVEVDQRAAGTSPGEQGAWDFLQVSAASGGAMVVAIKAIPEFIRSRRSDASVSVKMTDREIVITAANAADALQLLEKAMDA
jgi:hypothetical protein